MHGNLRAYMLQTNKTTSEEICTPNLPGMHDCQPCIRVAERSHCVFLRYQPLSKKYQISPASSTLQYQTNKSSQLNRICVPLSSSFPPCSLWQQPPQLVSYILYIMRIRDLDCGQLTFFIDTDVLTKHANVGRAVCYWTGKAPMCRPSPCKAGYQACQEDFCGDGLCCPWGRKVKCCEVNPNVPSCT